MQSILILEDYADLANLIAGVLEEEGYSVRAALKTEHALAFCREQKPDLIISDLFGNGTGTLEFFKDIRSKSELQSTPFVLLTDSIEMVQEEKTKQIKAAAYITKPFDLNAFLTAVNKILPRK